MTLGRVPRSEAEHARSILGIGILVFRWTALAWMIALALTREPGFARPALAWFSIGAAGAWTAWMSIVRDDRTEASLWYELALAFVLNVISGVVVVSGSIVGGSPFFATAWPAAAVVAWGVARGPLAGVLSGLALGLGLVLSRAVNGISIGELTGAQVQGLANGTMTYVLAGGAVGQVARLLERSAAQFNALVDESMAARERAARLAERESIARQIHDSVLQALAMVHKRGRELAMNQSVPSSEVAALAEVAGKQEEALRALILREPEEPPTGRASLRDTLEAVARAMLGVPVTVSAVGPIWIDAHHAREIGDAVRQALDNVIEHAGATKATVFAEALDRWVSVSVRDDGSGFVYDEERLRADGKAGLLKSMKGRIEALGGRMEVDSAPRAGTEVEFLVPTPPPDERGD